MLKLRSDFLKNSDNNSDQYTCISKVNQLSGSVSTCMSSYLSADFTLPHIPVIANQENITNLMVELAMLDTGSQISIVNLSLVKKHKFINTQKILPMLQNCSLKSATGKSYNPFSGRIILELCFIDKFKRTTKKIPVQFHVLAKENELECLLLGLNFLMPHLSEIFFK